MTRSRTFIISSNEATDVVCCELLDGINHHRLLVDGEIDLAVPAQLGGISGRDGLAQRPESAVMTGR